VPPDVPSRPAWSAAVHAVSREDLALAVQGHMVGVLARQHVREQARAGQPALDRPTRGTGLHDGAAPAAGELGPDMAHNVETAGL
jgi:hypothetical protein